MRKLEFEKVADIQAKYPYLCIYLVGDKNPFMEIGISDDKKIEFTIYAKGVDKDIKLDSGQWREILERAEDFAPKVIADEEFEEQYVPPDKYT